MPRSWFGLILGFGAAGAAAQSGTSTFSLNLVGKGSGQGLPGYISAHLNLSASALSVSNFVGGITQIPLSVAGIVGDSTNTEIFLAAAANPKDFLHFTDSAAKLNNMGRGGTATLDYGGGAFEKATGTVIYNLVCTQVCFNGVGKPVGDIFAFGFSFNGTLYLPTATAQAILPSIMPAPTVSPSASTGCSVNVAVTPNGVDVVAYDGGGGSGAGIINRPVANLSTAPSGSCFDGGGGSGSGIINQPVSKVTSAPNSSCPYEGGGGTGSINQSSANVASAPSGTCFDGGGGSGGSILRPFKPHPDASGSSGPSASLVITPPWQPVQTEFSAAATCSNLSTCWMTIPAGSGSIPPFTNTPITVDFNFGALGAGVYPANFSLTLTPSGGSASTESVPFNLIVGGSASPLQLSETGLQFQAVAGSPQGPPAHSISLFSPGAALAYTAAASTLTGGNWLSAVPASGSTAPTSNGTVSITANPTGLAAGAYFGRVDISAPNSLTPLQSVEVELTVAAAAGAAPILPSTGVIFVTPLGANPQSQQVTVSTFSSSALTVTGQASADDLSSWLTGKASSTSLQAGQPITETLSVDATGLASGIYTGTLYESVTDTGAQSAMTVLLIVTPASGTACTATQLLPVITNLGANFELQAGLPVSVQTQIVDDCGVPLTSGSVQASFSSGDSAVTMTPGGNGLWSGTWAPHGITGGPVSVGILAQSAAGLTGSASLSGTLDANTTLPVVTPGGIVSAANPVSGSAPPWRRARLSPSTGPTSGDHARVVSVVSFRDEPIRDAGFAGWAGAAASIRWSRIDQCAGAL